MERRADRQRHDTPGAERLGSLAGASHRIARPGNHHLAARHSCSPGSRFRPRRPPRRPAVTGRGRVRGWRPWRHCRQARPPACSGRAVARSAARRQTKGSCSDVRGVLSQAVARHKGRREPAGCKQPIRGNAGRQNGGLSVFCQRKLIFGALETETAERLARAHRQLSERLATNGEGIGKRLAHADLLRSLPRKNEGNQYRSRGSRVLEVLEVLGC